ncbi:hypothetical protein C1645_744487 [Glomus cerebriforme]|uniref:Serine-threonine/tyrosine-protein kinase catalytic domain-containing protein n=1 Tax=Glomus cerebriforme TaxID=658196 RepID=A0A397SBU9_9GLOM|nr:hypothetical protein C1645_744487 [Glomus cerebriforme]
MADDNLVQWLENGISKDYINYYYYNEFKNINPIGRVGKLVHSLNNDSFIKEIVNEIVVTLRNYLKDNFSKLDWNIKLQFAIQIADAVSCMHQKDIIHRDLILAFHVEWQKYQECWKDNPDDRPDMQQVFFDLKSIKNITVALPIEDIKEDTIAFNPIYINNSLSNPSNNIS